MLTEWRVSFYKKAGSYLDQNSYPRMRRVNVDTLSSEEIENYMQVMNVDQKLLDKVTNLISGNIAHLSDICYLLKWGIPLDCTYFNCLVDI